MRRWRFCVFGLGLAALAAGPRLSADDAQPSAAAEISRHYAAILKARDALVGQLAGRLVADAKVEPGRDVSLVLKDAIVRREEDKGLKKERRASLDCRLSRRGGKWFAGTARTERYNVAQHEVDPSGLTLAGGRLSGRLKVTLRPDPWVPPDGKCRHIRCEIEAKVSEGRVAGTFRADGDYGPAEGKVSGRVVAVSGKVDIPSLGEEAKLPADAAGRCLRMAVLASRAYQQSRAVVLSTRHWPLSFADALELTRLPVPQWTASDRALEQVRDYLAELRRLLERQVRGEGGDGRFVIDTLTVEDPFFGPYFDDEPLATNARGAAVLPAGAGSGNSQRWQRIARWRTIAAFVPDPRRDLDTPDLPEIVPAAGARYEPSADRLGSSYKAPEGGTFSWTGCETPLRFISPPGQTFDPVYHHRGGGQAIGALDVHGVQEARWYGAAEVESERNVELYASAYGREYGKLWVNGRLAWVGRSILGDAIGDPPLLEVRLRKGRNSLLFCCESRRGASYFWLMLCTSGKPLSAAERAARREAQRAATAALPPDPRRGRTRGRATEAKMAEVQGQLSDRKQRKAFRGSRGSPVYFRHKLMALDQQTGELAWERPIWASGGYGCPGGIVPMRLSDGRRTREVVVTGTGLFVDPRDGRLLNNAMGVGKQCYYGDPFVAENRAYFYRGSPVWAAEVWLEPDGRLGSKLVAHAPRGGGNAAATYWKGYVFGSNGHSAGKAPVPWHDVYVADMRTGEVVGSIVPALREGGLAYTPGASVEKYGVVVGTGPGPAAWSITPEPAEIGFFVPGPKPYLVSTCKLDGPMVAQPVFEGRRMYARTYDAVLCIGITGAEGEKYALRRKARTILSCIPPRPSRAEIPAPAPVAGYSPPRSVPVEPCEAQTAPSRWLFVGPFPRPSGKDLLEAIGGAAKALLEPGREVSIGNATHKVAPLDAKFVRARKGWREDYFGRRVYLASCTIDVVGPIKRRKNSLTYYYAVLHNRQARVVAADVQGSKGLRVWIGGAPVRSGSRLRLAPGYYPVLLAVEVTVAPPFGKVVARFRIRDVKDPNRACPEWLKAVDEARPRLEEIIRELPGSAVARRARLILKSLEPQDTAPTAPAAGAKR